MYEILALTEWFYGGSDFARQILPAHRSAAVYTTTSRSRSAQVDFRLAPLRFPLRSVLTLRLYALTV